MKEVLPPGEHSPLGPSSAERWIHCPGSVLATQGIADKTSRFSAEGTVAHEVAQRCAQQNKEAGSFVGDTFVVGGHEILVDFEMAEGVNDFLVYCDEAPGEGFQEVRVAYELYVTNGFGTADDIHIDDEGEVCTVTDFKYGKGVQVFAKDNTQLKCYALGAWLEFKGLYKFKTFNLRICQPRLDHHDEWEISLDDLCKWAREVLAQAAMQALIPNAKFAAGEWCGFCRIKGACKTRAAFVMQQVAGSTDDFKNLDEDLDAAAFNPADSAKMSTEQLAKAWTLVATIKRWCTDVESQVMRLIQSGQNVGDIKLVEGRSTRKWASENPYDTEAALQNRFNMEGQDLWKRELLSVAKIEEMVGKRKFKADADDLVNKPPGKPKLAAGSDKRPPITASALADFDVLEDDEE